MSKKEARLAALHRQTRRLETRLAARQAQSDRFTNLRLALSLLFVPVVVVGLLGVGPWAATLAGLLVIAAFALAVRAHRRVEESARAHDILLHFTRTQIARIMLDWEGIPAGRAPLPDGDHPFALDLDLVGANSVHQLIDTALSREGSARLQAWLLAETPDPDTIAERHALLRELIPMTRFRHRLVVQAALASRDLSEQWEGARLLAWLEQRTPPDAVRGTLIGMSALAALNAALFVLNVLGVLPPLWAATVLVYGGIFITRRGMVEDLFGEALYLLDGLRKLGAVLGVLESYPYADHARLRDLCAPLLDPAHRPSDYFRRVNRVASAASLQGNPFLWLPLNVLVPWDLYFAYRMAQQKAALADRLPAWLHVWFELEALNSLANFAYLNPEYTFPEIVPNAAPVFDGRRLGHPLIPFREKVCNDFRLDALGEAVIVTGSNMSGKSSFLRTVGVNLALAYAGSVVDAEALITRRFRLFTSIRVTDSVIDGISYFYAEVKRLRALLDALQAQENGDDLPLLFLIDEIFRGTNNRERLIGSRAYIEHLVERRATGLLATHDLELVHLAEGNPRVKNYHFRETVADGRMLFDYTLRPGPCPTTNALVIMRMEGLPVPGGEEERLD